MPNSHEKAPTRRFYCDLYIYIPKTFKAIVDPFSFVWSDCSRSGVIEGEKKMGALEKRYGMGD
jgi:hypothetical protein